MSLIPIGNNQNNVLDMVVIRGADQSPTNGLTGSPGQRPGWRKPLCELPSAVESVIG